ncbi:hypothetical protein [Synechococcus sp. MIT S1220]
MERSQYHPLTMGCRHIWLEVDDLLLISDGQPALTVVLFQSLLR